MAELCARPTLSSYDMRYDRHRCGLPHEKFSPQKHQQMFIDLDCLPADAPMMRFDTFFTKPVNNEEGINIPLIIAGPLYALSELHFEDPNEEQYSFVGQLDNCSYRDPQPYNEKCPVCQAVKKILTECKNYAECREALKGLKSLQIYQVSHEIWCRLQPIPLALDGFDQSRFENFVYSHITRFKDISQPDGEKITPPKARPWPERRDIMLEWTNGYAYLTHKIIVDNPEEGKMQRAAAGFILTFMLRFLRGYTTHIAPELTTDPTSPYFFIDAIKALYEQELNAIDAVALHLYPVLLRIPCCQQTDYDVKKILKNAMRSMLTMNVQEAFIPGVKIQQYYKHKNECETNHNSCWCRWAKYLEENPHPPAGAVTEPTREPCKPPQPPPQPSRPKACPKPPVVLRKGRGIDPRALLYYGRFK